MTQRVEERTVKTGVRKGFIQLASLSILGYGLAFFVQLLTSYYFGTSATLDSYWLAMAAVTTLGFYVGPMREASIPEFYRRRRNSEEDGFRYISGVANLILLLALVGALAAFLAPAAVARVLFPGRTIADEPLVRLAIRWLAPAVVFLCATDLLNGVLVSYHEVIYQEVGRVLDSGLTIVCLAVLAPLIGIKALLISTVAAPAGLFVIQAWKLHSLKLGYRPLSRPTTNGVFLRSSGLLLFSYALSQVYVLFERATFVHLGQGLLSSFQYARTISNMPDQIITASLTTALWPSLLSHAFEADVPKAFSVTIQACRYLVITMAAITLGCFLFTDRIVYLVFFRGAFDARSLALTSESLRLAILMLCPLGAASVVSRVLVSLQRYKLVMAVGTVSALAGMAALAVARVTGNPEVAMAHLVVSNLASCAVSFIALFHACGRKPTAEELSASLLFVLKIGAAALLVYLALPSIPFSPEAKWLIGGKLAIEGAVVMGAFLGLCVFFGAADRRFVLRAAKSLLARA